MANTRPEPRGSLAWHPWKYLIPSKLRGRQVPPTESAIGFPHYRHPGERQFMVVIIIIFVIEIPLVHLILDRFSPVAAWIVTGLTLLMALWIAGVFLAARQRLSWISQSELHVNDRLFTEYHLHRNNFTDISLTPIGQLIADVQSTNEGGPVTARACNRPEPLSTRGQQRSDRRNWRRRGTKNA